jgi:hypothetical protein
MFASERLAGKNSAENAGHTNRLDTGKCRIHCRSHLKVLQKKSVTGHYLYTGILAGRDT